METNNNVDLLRNCKISERTANFIVCSMQLEDLFSNFYEALAAMYSNAWDIISGEFSKKSDELRAIINEYIIVSITENIGFDEFSEI